jgi:uncharacterized protein
MHFVKKAEGGHDWFHIERVCKNALIAKNEKFDLEIVKLGALLNGVADSKFHDGDEMFGPKIAREFIESENIDEAIISHVIQIIKKYPLKKTTLKKILFNKIKYCSRY